MPVSSIHTKEIMKTLISTLLLFCLGIGATAFGQTTDQREEKARQAAAKVGTGSNAKVDVKLRDGSKLKGYITSVNSDSISLVDDKGGATRDVRFADIQEIKKRGGLSTGAKIAISTAVAGTAAIVFGIFLVRCRNELGCGAGR